MKPELFDSLSWSDQNAELSRAASVASAEKYETEKRQSKRRRKFARDSARFGMVKESLGMEEE